MRWAAVLTVAVVASGALPAGSAPDRIAWTSNGPDGGGATYIEIDPRSPSTLYVGTNQAGVFRSTNGGGTWERRSNGLPPNAGVGRLELAPSDPSRIYAIVGSGIVNFFTSTDAGATWRQLPRPEHGINQFVVDPSQPRTLYATSDRSLIKSTDGGQTWSQPIIGSDGPIAIAPSAPNVLYAEVYGRLRRSTDGGATWTEMTGSFSSIDLIVVDPRNADVVYFISSRDLWKSTSGGSSPSKIRAGWPPAPGIETFAVDPRTPSTIYAGTSNDGVFRSRDGGATWDHAASGLAEFAYQEVRQRVYEGIRDIEVSPAAGSPVYLTHQYRGVYKTENGGNRWHEANDGLAATKVWAVEVHPRAPSVVYAATVRNGVWRSADGGRHWTRRGLTGRFVTDVTVDPVRRHVVWAATSTGLYRSGNDGRTWKRRLKLKDRSVSVVAIAPSNRRFMYAGTSERGLYRSWNGGRTWTRPDLRQLDTVSAVVVHPRRPRTLWVAVGGYVLRSRDGGVTYLDHPREYATGKGLVLHPRNPRTQYMAVENTGIYRSRDGGANWARISNDAPYSTVGLAIDPKHPRVLYTCGWDRYGESGGVYRSVDGARSWTNISSGMTTTFCSALAITPSGKRLYVGSGSGEYGGGGVFAATVR
jgi:photosystem II stability/assembly factor-like uncharacterized protein